MKRKPSNKLPKRYRRGFLTKIHAGTILGRRLNGTFSSLVADCGGVDAMTRGKLLLLERLTFMQEFLSQLEQEIASDPVGKIELLGRWTQGVNSMSGLVKTLGLDRDKQQDFIDALYSEVEPPDAADDTQDTPSNAHEGTEGDNTTARRTAVRTRVSRRERTMKDDYV